MIEIRRAKMGLPTTNQNGTPSASTATASNQSSRSNAQDERIHNFLTRLHHTKPTVPPSLTRRILNKQGVGYSDPLVSTVISAAADRFLATILSQALVCKDRRLKGEELARKDRRELERMLKRRRAERNTIARKKQKLEQELEDMVKSKAGVTPQKKDKKISSELTTMLDKNNIFVDSSEKDCVDEEEDHYDKLKADEKDDGDQSYEEDESDEDDEEDEDEDRDILQLRDLVRPLEAWGLSLTGKMGLATEPTVRTPKEKTTIENDDENVGLEGDPEAGDAAYDEDEEMPSANEKTPTRKKKATGKIPSPSKGRTSPVPGKASAS